MLFRAPRSAFLTLILCAPVSAQDPWPILDRASTAYDAVHSLSADFVQTITNPLVGEPDTTRGRLYQTRPNAFAMRFTVPRGDRIVADGKYLWLFTPSTTPGQVIRTPIPTFGTGPNLIGQFVDHPRERYQARLVGVDTLGAEGIADGIALEPKDPSKFPYRSAVIWVARSDGLVRRLEIAEASGQERTVELRRLDVNGLVSPREYQFAVPAGVHVVDQ
jgi:outer membrane lipoprotein carrier protein